jgi:CDP-glucose 4,6-dehydratase
MSWDSSWADAYRGRRVLVTGHTGFKGGWLSLWLASMGAEVTGYSLSPPTDPCLFVAARVADQLAHVDGDVRNIDHLRQVWRAARPQIVFHLAAQPIVRTSYRDPLTTVSTNVLGTTHVLELARECREPLALVIVTSDKCYENREWVYGYREDDTLGGRDVYSASKAAAELVVRGYRCSFFPPEALATHSVALASARAGNVIGGGDWAPHRIVPDCVRALAQGGSVAVRNPHAVRPWQHVLEPVSGYLALGARLLAPRAADRAPFCDAWNFGPAINSSRTVGDLVDAVVRRWGSGRWQPDTDQGHAPEASLLRLAIDKAQTHLAWSPRWDFAEAVTRSVDWYRAFYAGEDVAQWCRRQIAEYQESNA